MNTAEETKVLDMLATDLALAGVRPADVRQATYMKWGRPDGGYVLFNANYRGDFGRLSVRWKEDDGTLNGPWAPISYAYMARLVRDIGACLAPGPLSRDETVRLGKR